LECDILERSQADGSGSDMLVGGDAVVMCMLQAVLDDMQLLEIVWDGRVLGCDILEMDLGDGRVLGKAVEDDMQMWGHDMTGKVLELKSYVVLKLA